MPGPLSPRLHEGLVRLGAWMPFDRAAAEMRWFCGVGTSEATTRRLTEAAGAAYVTVQMAAADTIAADRPRPPGGPVVQQISVDGAMVPLVGGEWGEVKMLAIGTVVATRGDESAPVVRTDDVSYYARMTDHVTFGHGALVETHRRGTESAGTVVAVADGADWLQGFIDVHRPDAVRVLDFPHAVEYLNAAGQATFGVGAPAAASWLATQVRELAQGDPDVVLAALGALPVQDAVDIAGAGATRDRSLAYLKARRAQIDYARFRRCGFPIGSGMVESAHKTVIEARLKGAGMHWTRAHVNPMAALRTAVCADRWAEAWQMIVRQLRAQTRGHLARHRPARGLSAHQASRPLRRRRSPPRLRVAPMPPAPQGFISSRSWRHAFQPHRRAAVLTTSRAIHTKITQPAKM